MAAAAQDHQGNIAFEYSAGSETEKPSILFCMRGWKVILPSGYTFLSPSSFLQANGVARNMTQSEGTEWEGNCLSLAQHPRQELSQGR